MPRCDDYPCCGHGPAPFGDGGGCPDEQGRFTCVLCGVVMPVGATSSICTRCSGNGRLFEDDHAFGTDDPRGDDDEVAMHGLGREDDEDRYGGDPNEGDVAGGE